MKTPHFNAPPLSYLSEIQLKKLHKASVTILEDVGSIINHKPTLEILLKHGARVSDNQTFHLSETLVNWAIDQAPDSITIFNRNQEPSMELTSTNVYILVQGSIASMY